MKPLKQNKGQILGVSLIAFLWVLGAPLAMTQVSASLSGRVEDPSGAAIPSASVTVTSVETGAARTVTSDPAGTYLVLSLPVGRYEVRAEKDGFKATVQKGINLVVGQVAVVNLKLEVGEIQQEVTVTAEALLVNTSTASVSGLVGEKEVKDLPLNGRSFDNLITLNVGTINYTGFKTRGSPNSHVGNFFSVAGRRPGENLFLLNGMEYAGPSLHSGTLPGGVSGQMLGIDAVREFNALSDTYSAEYGKRPGAQISIVTQSGTNRVHGSVFEFLRNDKLDARNFFDRGEVPPFRRNQFGGSGGGPVRKDQTFVFANYEGFRQRLGLSNVAVVPNQNARQGLLPAGDPGVPVPPGVAPGTPTPVPSLASGMLRWLALWPEANGRDLGGGLALSFSNPQQSIREDFGTVRLDHRFSLNDSVSTSYTVDDGEDLTPLQNPLFARITTLRNQVLSLQETHIFSSNMINTFTAGFSRSGFFNNTLPIVSVPNLSIVKGRPPGLIIIGGGVSGGTGVIAGVIPAGGGTASSFANGKSLFSFEDRVQLIKGRHQIGAGVSLQRLRSNEDGAFTQNGLAVFGNLLSFLQGTAAVSLFVGETTPKAWRQMGGAWYLDDQIQVRPNLTVRLGLRHEFTNGWNEATGRSSNFLHDSNGVLRTEPMVGDSALTENNAKRLFGPRVALAWDPFGKGKTSIRAGFGTHYVLQDFLGTYVLAANPPFNGQRSRGNISFLSLTPIDPSESVPPTCNQGVPQPCTTFAPTLVESAFKTPTIEKWNFAVEQQITSNMSLRMGYVGSHGFHEVVVKNPNVIRPQICSNPSGCASGGVGAIRGVVPQGAQFIPVGTLPNPFLPGNGFAWFMEGTSNYHALQAELKKRTSRGLQFRANWTWSKNLDTNSGGAGPDAGNQPQMILDPYNMRSSWGPSSQDFRHQASISGSYELPFGQDKPWLKGMNGVVGKLVSGWQMNWIVSLLSGFPITPQIGSNRSGNGDSRTPDRPSENPNFTGSVILGTPDKWFDPNAYILPVPGTFGNVGRGVLRGPGLSAFDLSLFKNTRLTEEMNLQFRAEFFNILNRTNFGVPNVVVTAPSAGIITSTTTTSRQIQFGLKLIF